MHIPLNITLVGGDARQFYLADLLEQDGHRVSLAVRTDPIAEPALLTHADCVLLPMPLSSGGDRLFAPLCPVPVSVPALFRLLRPEQQIFAGKVPTALRAEAEALGLTVRDYLLREELVVANAVPTAEGALALAIDSLPITIRDSRVLVTGFGRVGQAVARTFRAIGAEVTVAARNPLQRTLAQSLDCRTLPLPLPDSHSVSWDLVINTVPARVLPQQILNALGSSVLLELASAPGGFDPKDAEASGLRVIAAPGLPGKTAPATAARIIRDTLYLMSEDLRP